MAKSKKVRLKLPSQWSIEQMTSRMQKTCCQCEKLPEGVRLVRQIDSYPYPTKAFYCRECASAAMRNKLLADEALIVQFESAMAAAVAPPSA